MDFNPIQSVFNGQRTWVAQTKVGNFVILCDYGEYTASYKRVPYNKRHDIIGYDNRVKTFDEAKSACERFAEGLS